MGLKHSKVQENGYLVHENRLLDLCEHAFAYFQLEDLAKIISTSKRFMDALSRSPRLFILILKKYYLSKDHLHPKIRRYFQILLTKRPKINVSNLSGVTKEIYLLAEYRINISKNLIRDVYCEKKQKSVSEINGKYCWKDFSKNKSWCPLIERTHGGDGWLLGKDTVPEFRKRTLISSFEMCEIAYKAFFGQFPPGFLQDFKNGRTVIKAGCFISRRHDCEAQGGCILRIFNAAGKRVFQVKQYKKSEEIPTSEGSNYAFQEIIFRVSCKDLPENIDLEECEMKLTIYGKDERWWAGHYGPRFNAMYIRGDYLENPLERVFN